jgi:formate dehydrogenase
MKLMDAMIRVGRHGDRFGLRRNGLNLRRIYAAPHGIVLAEHPATGVLARKVRHRDRRVQVFHPDLVSEVDRLHAAPEADTRYPLRLIGRRETRSHNSWFHNVPSRHQQAALEVHPHDAQCAGISDGDVVCVISADGEVRIPARVTDDVVTGTVTMPHGWGHDGGWRRANARAGANYNVLTAARVETVERLSGMSHLNGVPVRLERTTDSPSDDAIAHTAAAQ